MAEKITRRGGKKNRKHGNNKLFCEKYEREGRRLKNKIRRMIRHIKRFPDDFQAVNRLKAIS
jgi:hypothetical protein